MISTAPNRDLRTAAVLRPRHPVVLFHGSAIWHGLREAGVPVEQKEQDKYGKFIPRYFEHGEPTTIARYARSWFAHRANTNDKSDYWGSFEWCYRWLEVAVSEGWATYHEPPPFEEFRATCLRRIDEAWEAAKEATGCYQMRLFKF